MLRKLVTKILGKTAQVVYSATFWSVSFVWMGGLAVAWAAAPLYLERKRAHKLLGMDGMAVCNVLSLSKVEIIYDPGFDPERRSMFCQNHVNLMDAHMACASITHPFCGMMNSWQFYIPVYGWIMKLAQGISVGKGANRYHEVAAAARARAAAGLSILVFPEAHRTLDGKVQPFKKGVFLMAREAGLPVVPLATHGMFELNHKGTWLFTPTKITVYVGAQIETAGLSMDELRKVISRTEKIVRDFSEHGIMPGAVDEPAPAGELVGT